MTIDAKNLGWHCPLGPLATSIPQCSHLLHWPYHQRRLANCDWMSASYTSGQPSSPRRHTACWAS